MRKRLDRTGKVNEMSTAIVIKPLVRKKMMKNGRHTGWHFSSVKSNLSLVTFLFPVWRIAKLLFLILLVEEVFVMHIFKRLTEMFQNLWMQRAMAGGKQMNAPGLNS